jgi:hypothetical protein
MVKRMCLMVAAALVLAACCPLGGVGTKYVKLRPQETANWCWAGTTQMVTETLGEFIDQCEMANRRFNRNDCCTSGCPKNPVCNTPGWTMFTEYGYTFDNSGIPLSWQQITSQICQTKKPMAYAYGPQSGGVGHVVVIYGFIEDGGNQSLLIDDPWAPCTGRIRVLPFQDYTSSMTTNHWATMYNVTKAP